jgi:hypothetical protein
MKAIETIGTIDQNGQIILTKPLKVTSESPVKVIILLEETNKISSETHLKSAVESFAQGWKEVMTGKTHPLDELWIGIENE